MKTLAQLKAAVNVAQGDWNDALRFKRNETAADVAAISAARERIETATKDYCRALVAARRPAGV